MPKRKARQSKKAVSAEPPFQFSFSSKPEIIEPIPPKVGAITVPKPVTSPGAVLGLAQEKPVPKSPALIVKPVNSSVAAANPALEYFKSLRRERIKWGVAVAVSWALTVMALLRLTGRI